MGGAAPCGQLPRKALVSDITFSTLGVPAPLLSVLAADGKTEPFPIQADTLPDTLAGRDVLGRGKTGSGKTIAFAIPLVARLGGSLSGGKRCPGRPLALILAPTRELATQIDAVVAPLAAAYNLTTTTIFGGVSQARQVSALKSGVDIIVACPGRLEDLMKQGFVSLDAIEITVIDEADHMADLGFLPVVTRILEKTPSNGQRLLFSATLDNGVDKLVRRFLHDEVLHSVDEANSPVAAMTHHVFEVETAEAKKELVEKLASGTGRRILFLRTKHHAKKLAKQLTASGIPAVDLHGNLSQPQRDRNLKAFGEGTVRVLVATDVAARGVHVDDVELVVHVDPPMEHKAYLHRSGRTARAGSEGDVVTVSLPAQRSDLSSLLRKAKISVKPTVVTAESREVTALVGDVAAFVKPAPEERRPQGGGTSQGANARRKRATREGDGGGRGQGGRDGQRNQDGRSRGQNGASEGGRGQGGARRGGRDESSGQRPARDAAPRTAGGRSGGQSGGASSGGRRGGASTGAKAPLRVGSLVGGRSGGSGGTSRGNGPRRAQG
ncbi:DEAD/DEAH box helicase [Labedella endophytica]|uniref:DEAD/DEAH box helicase n=1 Tax=Labedella endophytica TaxID=1523160 RepID=A0A433JWW9_9MICO|nr:DEAD/DEAH box helicase [Labedella endophytica]